MSTSSTTTTTTTTIMTIPTSAQEAAPSTTLGIVKALTEYLQAADKLRVPADGLIGSTIGTAGTAGASGVSNSIGNVHAQEIFDEFMAYGVGEGDAIFEKYGPGNSLPEFDRPFERARAYETFLKILHNYNEAQFLKIHKGTPYYFIAWTSFQFMDYSKALFYMDAALSDDLRFADVQLKTRTTPAVDFFLLRDSSPGSGFAMHEKLNEAFDLHLKNFNNRSGMNVTKGEFVDGFVTPLLYGNAKNRSLLTALYTFLLNYEKRVTEITLRSDTGGSINVFIDELFDGARLLESLLELAGGTGGVLRTKIQSLTILALTNNVINGNQTLADAERKYNTLKIGTASFQDCVFAASYIVRNTAGHSLIWDDGFVNHNSYTLLYNCLIDSIFWTVYKCWIE